MARGASNNVFGTFLIASVLREDPRFYVKKDLTFKQAVKYMVPLGSFALAATREAGD